MLVFLNHSNREHLVNGLWCKFHNKKFRMLRFLFVDSWVVTLKQKPKPENKTKKGLISDYFLLVPVYSRLFYLIIKFFLPKNMCYLKFYLQCNIFKMANFEKNS